MTRWTASRKEYVVRLWNAGYMRMVGAILAENNISVEEFGIWVARFDLFGTGGLHTTKSQRIFH